MNNSEVKEILFLGDPLGNRNGVSKAQTSLRDALKLAGLHVEHLTSQRNSGGHTYTTSCGQSMGFKSLMEFIEYATDRGISYDIVHSHCWGWSPSLMPEGMGVNELLRHFRSKLVFHFHSYLPREEKSQREMLVYSDRTIHPTEAGERYFYQNFSDKSEVFKQTRVVPNIVPTIVTDPDRVRRLRNELSPNGEIVLLYVGRFSSEKGTREIGSAFKVIHGRCKTVKLCCLGFNKEYGEVETFVSEVQEASRNVHSPGWVSEQEVAEYQDAIKEIGLQIVPSHHEAFCLAATKAASRGCPVAVSDIPVFRTLYRLDSGQPLAIGIFPVSCAGIVSAFDYFLANPSFVKAMAQRAAKHFSTSYSPTILAKQYIDIYKELLCSKPNIKFKA